MTAKLTDRSIQEIKDCYEGNKAVLSAVKKLQKKSHTSDVAGGLLAKLSEAIKKHPTSESAIAQAFLKEYNQCLRKIDASQIDASQLVFADGGPDAERILSVVNRLKDKPGHEDTHGIESVIFAAASVATGNKNITGPSIQ